MLRDHIIGQVRNENEVWIATLGDLRKNEHAEVRDFAQKMNQTRLAIVPNLLPGGSEVDFGRDRELHAAASAAYRVQGRKSARAISLVPLIPSLQETVAADRQSFTTVMQLIKQERLAKHPDKAALSEDALRTELEALFMKGSFDADGHIGNWLPDKDTPDLYRTDWSLFTVLDTHEREVVRDLFVTLINPRLTIGEKGSN